MLRLTWNDLEKTWRSWTANLQRTESARNRNYIINWRHLSRKELKKRYTKWFDNIVLLISFIVKSRISEVGSKFSVSSFAVRIDLSLQLSMLLVRFAAHVFFLSFRTNVSLTILDACVCTHIVYLWVWSQFWKSYMTQCVFFALTENMMIYCTNTGFFRQFWLRYLQ